MKRKQILPTIAFIILSAVLASGEIAQRIQQANLEYFGAQIGNEVDTTATGCYIGTAGTLVNDGAHNYILSNSHVLAREGQASPGEDIMHTVSTFCDTGANHVGELFADVPLRFGRKSTNLVDAAIARITPNVMPAKDGDGRVLHIGTSFGDLYGVSAGTIIPAVGIAVKKSGRTTGLTRSTISLTNVNVVVRYNGGRAYFTNQFVVSGSGFSNSGDSGSLIVTDDSNANPVGLLFAGSSSDTIGNPIDSVIAEFKRVHGLDLLFGATGDPGEWDLAPPPDNGDGGGKPDKGNKGNGGGRPFSDNQPGLSGLQKALSVRDRNEARFLEEDGILGSGIGVSNGSPSITVFVNRDLPSAARNLPASIEGVPVVVKLTDEFLAY